MINLVKYVLYLVLFSVLLGPSIRFPFIPSPINVYFSDIFISILAVILFLNYEKIINIIKGDIVSKIFLVIIAYFLLTLVISPISLSPYEKLISFLYLLRYFAYFSIYLAVLFLNANLKNFSKKLESILFLNTVCLIGIGWLQYFLYPDLRNLSYLGWDHHYKRIFGLIFDPNYLGLIIVIAFLTRHIKMKLNFYEILKQGIYLLTIAFTYSRSAYLALAGSLLFYSMSVKKFKHYFIGMLVFILMLFLLPRPGGVGVQLERLFSIKERLNNWRYASQIIVKNPVFGIGFNTLRFASKKYDQLPENWLVSHSAGGIDNSFLFIAVTSGLAGLSLYIYFLIALFKNSGILGKTVLVASIIHSQFINSLFFSFVLIWFWVILSMDKKVRL